MARLRDYLRSVVFFALASLEALGGPARAQDEFSSAVSDQPYLAIDAGTHTASVNSVAVDDTSKLMASASDDRTVRIWSIKDGHLLKTFYLPAGPLRTGAAYTVAFQPGTGLLAVGGFTSEAAQYPVYLLNTSDGSVVATIKGVGNATTRLAFSPDGRYLAAGTQGLHVFDRTKDWAEVFQDSDYDDVVYALQFSELGNLLVGSIDGQLRVYDPTWKKLAQRAWDWNKQPPVAAYRPDGKVIALPDENTLRIAFLDGETLNELPGGGKFGGGQVRAFVWSRDGTRIVLASGLSMTLAGVGDSVLACDSAGRADCVDQSRAPAMVISMAALAGGGIAVAGGARPFVAVRDSNGASVWQRQSTLADNQSLYPLIAASPDGKRITFRFEAGGRFLTFDASSPSTPIELKERDIGYEGNRLSGLGADLGNPVFKGHPLPILQGEELLARYITSTEAYIYLGTDREIYAYTGAGERLWRRQMPDAVRSVLPSQDGRLLIAALADSSIRWYDAKTGDEICALLTYAVGKIGRVGGATDTNHLGWVLWTPAGYYAASEDAVEVLQWRVNHGSEALATSVPVSSIPIMHRPNVFAPLLQSLDIRNALGTADLEAARTAVKEATSAKIQPGARLHVIAIGIRDYGPAAARLQLKFADKDAQDLASALDLTQGATLLAPQGFYAKVLPIFLPNQSATIEHITQAFELTEQNMQQGHGQDVAIVIFSGHGFRIGGSLYLLPYGVDTSSPGEIEATALPISQLQNLVGRLAANGQVIVLIDACHSGAAATDGTTLTSDASGLSAITPDAKTIVLTSSSGAETSYEDPAWQHGAFTKVLLEALDPSASGLHPISMAELAAFMKPRLLALSSGRQHLGGNMLFPLADRKILVAAPP